MRIIMPSNLIIFSRKKDGFLGGKSCVETGLKLPEGKNGTADDPGGFG
jgi:hypothetical protein